MPNSLLVAGFVVGALLLGYLFYGRFIARLWGIDPARKTPATLAYQVTCIFLSARNWLLAGIGIVLIILAVVMTAEGIATARKLRRRLPVNAARTKE